MAQKVCGLFSGFCMVAKCIDEIRADGHFPENYFIARGFSALAEFPGVGQRLPRFSVMR